MQAGESLTLSLLAPCTSQLSNKINNRIFKTEGGDKGTPCPGASGRTPDPVAVSVMH